MNAYLGCESPELCSARRSSCGADALKLDDAVLVYVVQVCELLAYAVQAFGVPACDVPAYGVLACSLVCEEQGDECKAWYYILRLRDRGSKKRSLSSA